MRNQSLCQWRGKKGTIWNYLIQFGSPMLELKCNQEKKWLNRNLFHQKDSPTCLYQKESPKLCLNLICKLSWIQLKKCRVFQYSKPKPKSIMNKSKSHCLKRFYHSQLQNSNRTTAQIVQLRKLRPKR
jgi:hypothetical protein